MAQQEETVVKQRKRKNYPGDEREPGTRDYGIILSNLINYRNRLDLESDEQKVGKLYLKIAEKLMELGYKKDATSLKTKVGRRKQGKFTTVDFKKKDKIVDLAHKKWEEAREKHQKASQE